MSSAVSFHYGKSSTQTGGGCDPATNAQFVKLAPLHLTAAKGAIVSFVIIVDSIALPPFIGPFVIIIDSIALPPSIRIAFGRLCTLPTHQITLINVRLYNFLNGEHGCPIYFNRIARHDKRQLRVGPFSGSQLAPNGLGVSSQHVLTKRTITGPHPIATYFRADRTQLSQESIVPRNVSI
jgi:hypothetical protein